MYDQDLADHVHSLTNTSGHSDLSKPNRREALCRTLGVGFAAAAAPVLAQQAIKTDTQGLIAGEVSIEVDGFKVPAYRAAPAGKSNLPVILVIHEIFGVHEYIADVTRRFAKLGYLAIAPEMYARQGDPGSYNEAAKIVAEIVNKVPDDQQMKDLDACAAWAMKNGGSDRLGITGFCRGGRTVWLYAAHNPKLKAAVSWYGPLTGNINQITKRQALTVAGQLQAPVLGLYGGADPGIPMSQLAQMQDIMAKGSKAAQASQFIMYPDTPHAFHADYRPSYREAQAKDGWAKCLAWFKAKGVV